LSQFQADVVLLDIQMPGMDGLAAAAEIAQLANPPVVIFCTAYDEHALDAFRVNAADYLLKPIRKEDLARALKRAVERLARAVPITTPAATRTHISAKTHVGLQLIPVASIRYFSADQKYVSVVHCQGETLIDDSLRQLENEFGEQLIRIHRSTLVTRQSIERLETNDHGAVLYLRGLEQGLPVSRRHLPSLRKLMKQL
jgi:two-component system response regulator AlgR